MNKSIWIKRHVPNRKTFLLKNTAFSCANVNFQYYWARHPLKCLQVISGTNGCSHRLRTIDQLHGDNLIFSTHNNFVEPLSLSLLLKSHSWGAERGIEAYIKSKDLKTLVLIHVLCNPGSSYVSLLERTFTPLI